NPQPRRFRQDRFGFPVRLLKQKIKLLPNLAIARQQLAQLPEMALQPRNLFGYVATFRQVGYLLSEPRLINVRIPEKLSDTAPKFFTIGLNQTARVLFNHSEMRLDPVDSS